MGPKFLIAVLVAVILAAVALYQHLGNRQDVQLLHMRQEKLLLDWEDIQAQRNPDPQRTRDLIAAIEARLAQRPDNLQYQFLLARYSTSLGEDRKSTRLNSSHVAISYAVFCLKKNK